MRQFVVSKIMAIMCVAFLALECGAQQMPRFDKDRVFDSKAVAKAIDDCKNDKDPIMAFDNGNTLMYYYVQFKQLLGYCVLLRSENDTPYVYHGFVELTKKKELKLCFGCIWNLKTNEYRRVRWDYDVAFKKCTPVKIPAGKYYFGPTLLRWDAESEYKKKHPNYNYDYTADGGVKPASGGYEHFSGEDLDVSDYIQFNANGRGQAIQNATASHTEWYSAVTPRYGPRGGYRPPDEQDGYINYTADINRYQPMTYKVDASTRELTMSYSPTMTSKASYDPPNHPVMTQIKASYSKWCKLAPPRFTLPDKFYYWGTFEDFIVISKLDSNINDPNSYIFVPKAGKMVETEQFGQTVELELGPIDLLSTSVERYINYITTKDKK